MHTVRRHLGRLALAALATVTLASGALAQVEWKFNNSYAPTRPESAHIRAFAADVEKRTGGKMKISVAEGGAMGLKDADALRFMQAGTPELGFIWPPFLGRDAPALANLYVYGLVSSAEDHQKALPALKVVLKEGIAKWNVEVPGFLGFSIVDASLFCREPVRTLDELKRKKLRVGSREQVETFKRLGVAAQIVPQNELYAALQTGVVDCALYAPRFANSISLQEVAKHVTPTGFPFPPAPYALLAHKAKWAALPADLKKGFGDAVTELERVSFNFGEDVTTEKAARERLTSQGVTFHPLMPAADRAALKRSALETWDVLAKEAGGDAVAYRQRILDALPK
ncbi:MAG: C4-dicarboxylate ABC transporter substrate-binding protein [Betaproteobacteria bacterium]|nr:C4-dicarboxylate ABC transporter substrate-binding protein [Betaproteobacteria bacterium]